ncbi:MAG TPA: hypothetical protein VFP72_13065 [Kineosporiaceae bacterium]|nr:hypothetical protein [Kineosporiaceae bacterium]
MTGTPITRALLLLLRDARGRFTPIRAGVAEKPARRRTRRPRPVVASVQLALF